MKAPDNGWDDLSEDRRSAIDARDISGWTIKQLRAEVVRRTPFADKEPVAYWIGRLLAAEALLRVSRQIENLPQHLGLKVEPDKSGELWRWRLMHVPSGLDPLMVSYPLHEEARGARERLLAVGDWLLAPDQWTSDQLVALQDERMAAWWQSDERSSE